MTTVGERIRSRRTDLGIGLRELARRAGTSATYLSELEHARHTKPSADLLFRIATELGTTMGDLLGKTLAPEPDPVPSPALLAMARANGLPDEDVTMLARIRWRGMQPASETDWWFLWQAIRRSIYPPWRDEGGAA